MSQSLKSFTTRDLIVVHWMETMEDAFGILVANKVRHLPVVDDLGSIVGLVSDRDFQRAMQIDQPDFTSSHIARPEFDLNTRVRDFMSWPVEAIEESASIAKAAQAMIEKKISSLIVVRGERVLGIVTSEDVLRAFVEGDTGRLEKLGDNIRAAIYNSPIGGIAQTLANVGV